MSSLWTPEGEHRVSQSPPAPEEQPPDDQPFDDQPPDEELAALQKELAATPAADIIANHCLGLFELAALHLSLRPPQLEQAALAIDAMGFLVEGLAGRLGAGETTVRDALAQVRIAYVTVKGG